jgi:hypothetical protein
MNSAMMLVDDLTEAMLAGKPTTGYIAEVTRLLQMDRTIRTLDLIEMQRKELHQNSIAWCRTLSGVAMPLTDIGKQIVTAIRESYINAKCMIANTIDLYEQYKRDLEQADTAARSIAQQATQPIVALPPQMETAASQTASQPIVDLPPQMEPAAPPQAEAPEVPIAAGMELPGLVSALQALLYRSPGSVATDEEIAKLQADVIQQYGIVCEKTNELQKNAEQCIDRIRARIDGRNKLLHFYKSIVRSMVQK